MGPLGIACSVTPTNGQPGRAALAAAVVVVVVGTGLFSACSTPGSDDTAAICSQAVALRAPGAVEEVRELWRNAGDGHEGADPRLIEAIELMQAAVPDQRTMDHVKWNRAHELLAEVCGADGTSSSVPTPVASSG